MLTQIDRIERHAKKIASGKHERVRPGQPERFTEACKEPDTIRQGDLYLTVIELIPDGYHMVVDPTVADRQLVPGNTQGSRHCLDSLSGVELHRPNDWPNSGLRGPVLVIAMERTIEHPTHGNVTIPAGTMIQCSYQREWDAEQKRERRNAD